MLYLNGAPRYEPYALEAPTYSLPLTTVPAGAIFVLGDNRNVSVDSHVWGSLPIENIIGKAFYVLYPVDRQARDMTTTHTHTSPHDTTRRHTTATHPSPRGGHAPPRLSGLRRPVHARPQADGRHGRLHRAIGARHRPAAHQPPGGLVQSAEMSRLSLL